MSRKIDLTGRRFGRLVVVASEGSAPSGQKRVSLWRCRCDCGDVRVVRGPNLTSGNTSSCGCQRIPAVQAKVTTHGLAGTPIYHRWRAMIQRCTNPRSTAWNDYGGRGIRVCERWRTFENFYADMGDPPEGMSLDRIDSDGNYEPGNVRWATSSRQARNKRLTQPFTLDGRTQSLADWADEYEADYQLVFYRVQRGWDLERALTEGTDHRRTLTFQGRTQTINEWATELGVAWAVLDNRVKRGWDDERTLSQPVRRSPMRRLVDGSST